MSTETRLTQPGTSLSKIRIASEPLRCGRMSTDVGKEPKETYKCGDVLVCAEHTYIGGHLHTH